MDNNVINYVAVAKEIVWVLAKYGATHLDAKHILEWVPGILEGQKVQPPKP